MWITPIVWKMDLNVRSMDIASMTTTVNGIERPFSIVSECAAADSSFSEMFTDNVLSAQKQNDFEIT